MYRGYEAIKTLKRETSRNIPDLLALARSNDPFYAGSPANVVQAQWFGDLWRHFGFTTGVHLRRIHYHLVSVETPYRKVDGTPYENTEECWDSLNIAGKYARYLGIVPVDAFEDHRNPEPRIYFSPRVPPPPTVVMADMEHWGLPVIQRNIAPFRWMLPEIEAIEGYDYLPGDQPYLVEVWVEKSTVDDVLEPICARYAVNLVSSIGFQSISSVITLLKRLAEAERPTRIFYISDFDPAGDSMPVSVARQVEYWIEQFAPGGRIKLTPLVLTREQVHDPQRPLPRIPIKASDRRRQGFEARYGEGAVELDALEALYPGRLAAIVREAIRPYRDVMLADRLADAELAARRDARRQWQDATTDLRDRRNTLFAQVKAITERYRERLDALDEALQADLAPLREPLAELREAVEARLDTFAPELPVRPTPEIEPPDEDAWLFDSARDYLTQLSHYHARKAE